MKNVAQHGVPEVSRDNVLEAGDSAATSFLASSFPALKQDPRPPQRQ